MRYARKLAEQTPQATLTQRLEKPSLTSNTYGTHVPCHCLYFRPVHSVSATCLLAAQVESLPGLPPCRLGPWPRSLPLVRMCCAQAALTGIDCTPTEAMHVFG